MDIASLLTNEQSRNNSMEFTKDLLKLSVTKVNNCI